MGSSVTVARFASPCGRVPTKLFGQARFDANFEAWHERAVRIRKPIPSGCPSPDRFRHETRRFVGYAHLEMFAERPVAILVGLRLSAVRSGPQWPSLVEWLIGSRIARPS
jgi:hypothetical protein